MGQTDAITTPRQLPDADQWLSGATQPASSTQGPPQPEQQGPQQSLPDADAWMENIQKQNYHDSVFPTIGRIITNTGVGYIEDAIKEGVNPLAPFGYVAKKAQESATSGFQQVPGFNSLVSKVSDMISPGSGAYGPQGITDETPVKDDLTAKAKSEGRALTTDEEEQIGAEAAMRPFGASTGIAFAPLAPLQPLFDGAIKEAQDRGMTKGNLALLNTALTVFSLHELLSHGSAPEIVTEGLANGTHTSEDVYMGLKDPTPAETEAAAIAAEKVPGFNLKRGTNLSTVDNTALEHELSSSEAPSSPSQDIHEAARKSDPETFKEWDALSRERDKHLDIINNLKSETPELDEYHRNKYSMQNDIEILKDKQEGANARKTKIYQKQIDDIQEKLDDLTAKNDVARESSSKLKEIENRQNDLSPKVIDAYKSVAGDEFTGKKSDPSFYPSTQPVDDSSTPLTVKGYVDDYIAGKGRDSLKHEQFAANNATEIEKEFQSRAGIKSPEDQHASIVSDIVKQATSKGYGVEEAQASAEVLARQYKYLSDIYGGAKGTAEELYNKEKPSIIKQGERLPKGKAPSVKTLAQGPAGKYHVLDSGLRVIRLMDSANESTLIHEGAHHFFDMMQRFEKEDGAPAKLKEDMALLRKEFGVKDGEDIQPTHEEKFARGFEAYLREGHAPTKALISVFQKFEKWLKAIYKTAKDIPNGQISDTVRNFFDRTLESNVALRDNPRNTVIAPERPGKMMADVHETDAKTTPPEHAAEVRDTVEKEIDKTAKLHDPEVADAIKSAETSDISESSTSDKDATVSEQPAGKTGSSEESGPLSASRNNSGRESAEARSESEPARSGNTTPGSPAAEPNRSAVSGAQYIKDGWFRLDKFNTSDDAKAMIRQAADQNSDFMDARYGSTAYKQAKEIEAANQLLVQAAESAAKITDKFAETGSAEDGAAYLRATQQLAIISNLAAEQRADWAHAGHQLQKQVIPENAANAAQTVMDASGKTLYQLQMEAKLVGKSKLSPKALGQLCEEARSSKFGKFNSVLLRIIFNSWLSNPITHLKYLTGIGITGLLKDTVQGAFEAGFSSLRGAKAGDKFYLGEIGAGLYGMGHGVRESLSAGTDAIKNGIMFMEGKVLPGL